MSDETMANNVVAATAGRQLPARHAAWLLGLAILGGSNVFAQSMSGDAREIGLGGIDHAAEVFSDEGKQPASQFVIPLGLLQLLADRKTLRPSSGSFDPSMVFEYAAVPSHYVIGRKPSAPRSRFIADIREAGLNPDLSTYRGFKPAATLEGAGILSPTWGHAFTLHGSPNGHRHQLYVGGGPYLSIETAALFDQRLVSLLGASAATYVPNSSLEIGNQSTGQAAIQITGGYRGQLPIGGSSGSRRMELEANYNQLQGFRYEDIDLNLRLDTNGEGLLSFDSPRGAPLAIDRRSSSRGRGFAMDLAAATIFDRWRVSVRADGIGNRINWTGVRHREYEMARLNGRSSRLEATMTEDAADIRISVPVQLRLQGAYRDRRWGAIAELAQGLQGTSGSAALEHRFSVVELRAGGRLVNRVVLPAAGVSLKAGHAWFDVGAAISTANIERQRDVVLASSIRFVFSQPPAGAVQ